MLIPGVNLRGEALPGRTTKNFITKYREEKMAARFGFRNVTLFCGGGGGRDLLELDKGINTEASFSKTNNK